MLDVRAISGVHFAPPWSRSARRWLPLAISGSFPRETSLACGDTTAFGKHPTGMKVFRSGGRRTLLAAWFAGLALMLDASAAPLPGISSPLLITQVPLQADAAFAVGAAGSFPESPVGTRLIVVSTNGDERVLVPGFVAASDPNVSFDGQRVLFAGRKEARAPSRIWEVGLDGQGLRAISPENLEARHPIHSATLFTLESPEPWPATVFVARDPIRNELGQPFASSLYSVRLDGTELRRLTYNPNRNTGPFQMWDGRVVYAAERYPNCPGGRPARMGLYAVHVEGTDMELYGGEGGRPIQQTPCATEKGLVVFVESDGPSGETSGQLACVEARRPHVSYRPLTTDPAVVFCNPSPLNANQVLVSRRAAATQGNWGLYVFDVQTGTCQPVFDTPQYHEVQAVAVQSRPRPDGHSTVVDPKYDTGIFYGLNCYDTDLAHGAYVRTGAVKRVRLIEGVPQPVAAAGGTLIPAGNLVPRRLIGEAPVEADGSFNVEVPADIPLLLQTLDDQGLALATCGWIWVKPREKRGCIGCHEDPERIPENNYVLALRRPSTRLVPDPSERRVIAFRETVAPILQRHCAAADCHGAGENPLRLPLGDGQASDQDLEQAYAALLGPVKSLEAARRVLPGAYVDAGQARTSPLMWQLIGRDTSLPSDPETAGRKAGRKVRPMPPPGKGEPLTPEELRTVIQWIDMGAPYQTVTGTVARPTAARP